MHAQSGWNQEIDLAIAEYSTFLPSKTPGLFLLHILDHCPFVLWIYPAASVTSLINTSKPEPLVAMHAHAIALLLHVPSLLHTFFFPSFWYRLILISAVQRMLFQKWSCFFRCFLQRNSNLALFAHCCEPSVFALVKKGFFFTMERILRSSTTVVLRGHPGLFMLLSSPVHSVFLRMYQTVDFAPNVPAVSLMDLFCFWSLIVFMVSPAWRAPLTTRCGFRATASKCKWHTLNQLQTFYLLNWCRNNEGIAHICPWNGFWVNCQITYSPFKKKGGGGGHILKRCNSLTLKTYYLCI